MPQTPIPPGALAEGSFFLFFFSKRNKTVTQGLRPRDPHNIFTAAGSISRTSSAVNQGASPLITPNIFSIVAGSISNWSCMSRGLAPPSRTPIYILPPLLHQPNPSWWCCAPGFGIIISAQQYFLQLSITIFILLLQELAASSQVVPTFDFASLTLSNISSN